MSGEVGAGKTEVWYHGVWPTDCLKPAALENRRVYWSSSSLFFLSASASASGFLAGREGGGKRLMWPVGVVSGMSLEGLMEGGGGWEARDSWATRMAKVVSSSLATRRRFLSRLVIPWELALRCGAFSGGEDGVTGKPRRIWMRRSESASCMRCSSAASWAEARASSCFTLAILAEL